jgi:transcription elongation factor Elf1
MMRVPENVKCPRCNEVMSSLQACHLICKNCGAHLDCSDKGSYW